MGRTSTCPILVDGTCSTNGGYGRMLHYSCGNPVAHPTQLCSVRMGILYVDMYKQSHTSFVLCWPYFAIHT